MATARRRPRLRLGIDLDGVVADFNAGWTSRYNTEFGAELHPDHVTEWNAPLGLTHFDSMRQFWAWARTSGDGASIFRILPTYQGAVDALDRLAERYRVVIITTKPTFAIHDTYAWLAEHRIPTSEVHIVDDKTTVECDVYLDDADHNLSALAAAHPDAVVCRYVRPWNEPHAGVVDVSGWEDFADLVHHRVNGA
ncbi:MAG: hypothetical protein AAGF73_09950 [Actinomycetota bacterium]